MFVYNGFPFHFEMIGFILAYCNKYDIEVTFVNKVINEESHSWINLYRSLYHFKLLNEIPNNLSEFIFVLLLTDDDMSFPDSLINNKTICVNHSDDNRRPLIKKQIKMLNYDLNKNSYLLPVFNYIDIKTKYQVLSQKKPTITILGRSVNNLYTIKDIVKNYRDFLIVGINRISPTNLPSYVKFYKNISAEKLFLILKNSTYILWISNPNFNHNTSFLENKRMTASLPISFTTGCKLILPKRMKRVNNHLKSILYYDNKQKLILDKSPNLKTTFRDREYLEGIRDSLLHKIV